MTDSGNETGPHPAQEQVKEEEGMIDLPLAEAIKISDDMKRFATNRVNSTLIEMSTLSANIGTAMEVMREEGKIRAMAQVIALHPELEAEFGTLKMPRHVIDTVSRIRAAEQKMLEQAIANQQPTTPPE